MPNDATFYQNQTLRRTTEVTAADWDDGMNRGGSNAPGVGIGTDNPGLDESLPNWTLLDQHGAGRTPQDSQHLGEGDPNEQRGDTPINVYDAENTDYNDTVSLNDLAIGWVRNAVV